MDIFENLIQVIFDAEKEAFDKEILTNAIVLNKKHDYTKAFVFENTIVPPMILGKRVIVADLPDKYSFALMKIDEPKDKFEELYEKIKHKRDNAQLDCERRLCDYPDTNIYDFYNVIGQIAAYHDILSLMESMFEVEEE